jgi:hypothetical protein
MVTIGLIAAGVAAVAATGVAVPWSRALLTTRVWPADEALARQRRRDRSPARQDDRAVRRLRDHHDGLHPRLGSLVSAFGPGPAFTSVALVYLIGSMVSSVAPTPAASALSKPPSSPD